MIDLLDHCMIKRRSLYSMCQQTKYFVTLGGIWSHDFASMRYCNLTSESCDFFSSHTQPPPTAAVNPIIPHVVYISGLITGAEINQTWLGGWRSQRIVLVLQRCASKVALCYRNSKNNDGE